MNIISLRLICPGTVPMSGMVHFSCAQYERGFKVGPSSGPLSLELAIRPT